MDVRIFRWPRFVELFEDFRELFADHLNRVKNKSSLDHFEAKNDIKEWEWRVMLSMCGPTDRIPAPFSSESLRVYMVMFHDHLEIEELVKIRDGRTPLHWTGEHSSCFEYCMTGRKIQEMNSSLALLHATMKRDRRMWLKRWNVKFVPWTSRNRSMVCKILGGMCRDNSTSDLVSREYSELIDTWIAVHVG